MTGFTGKPAGLGDLGFLQTMKTLGGGVWDDKSDTNIIALAQANAGFAYMNIDIEDSWKNSNANCIHLFDLWHQHAPGQLVGWYANFPSRDYWAPVGGDPAALASWHAYNDSRTPAAVQADIIFPSIYTFYADQAGWETYARANIAEAKQYGKPVIPFIWHHYHNSNAQLKGTEIAADYWRLQLDVIKDEGCAGVAIWGGWQVATNPIFKLNWAADAVNAPWWQATQEFLGEQQ